MSEVYRYTEVKVRELVETLGHEDAFRAVRLVQIAAGGAGPPRYRYEDMPEDDVGVAYGPADLEVDPGAGDRS